MATIKVFKGTIPPILKIGEIASNGMFLFLGMGDGEYRTFVSADKKAVQIENISEDTVMEIGVGATPNKFNALEVFDDGTIVATACSKIDIDGFHLNHPKDVQRNPSKAERILVTKEWVENYVATQLANQ